MLQKGPYKLPQICSLSAHLPAPRTSPEQGEGWVLGTARFPTCLPVTHPSAATSLWDVRRERPQDDGSRFPEQPSPTILLQTGHPAPRGLTPCEGEGQAGPGFLRGNPEAPSL